MGRRRTGPQGMNGRIEQRPRTNPDVDLNDRRVAVMAYSELNVDISEFQQRTDFVGGVAINDLLEDATSGVVFYAANGTPDSQGYVERARAKIREYESTGRYVITGNFGHISPPVAGFSWELRKKSGGKRK